MRRALILLSPLLLMSATSNLFVVMIFAATGIQQQAKVPPLKNKDVVEMVTTGLSSEIIVAKIKASPSDFDTSAAAMRELKTANVPDAVILAMVQSPTGAINPLEDTGSTGKSGETGEPIALVYVYRHKNFSSRNMQPSVYVDGVEVARMDDGKCFMMKLDPGKHTVEVNKGHSGAEIDMKSGERYYFRVDIKAGFWKGRSQIDYLQKEQGAMELKKMSPLDPKWIKDKSKASTECVNN